MTCQAERNLGQSLLAHLNWRPLSNNLKIVLDYLTTTDSEQESDVLPLDLGVFREGELLDDIEPGNSGPEALDILEGHAPGEEGNLGSVEGFRAVLFYGFGWCGDLGFACDIATFGAAEVEDEGVIGLHLLEMGGGVGEFPAFVFHHEVEDVGGAQGFTFERFEVAGY